LINGQLKIETPTEHLPATNLYARDETHSFMKTMPVSVEFLKNDEGKFEKMKVDDERYYYELNKVIDTASTHPTELKLSKDILLGRLTFGRKLH